MAAGWGGLCLGGGALAMTFAGGAHADCTTTIGLLAQGGSKQVTTACAVYGFIYYGGISLMVVGAVLLLAAALRTGARSSPASPRPGWYDDPTEIGMARWWDGERWSEQTISADRFR